MPQVEEREREETAQAEEQPERKGLFERNPRAKWIVGAVALVLLVGGLLFWMYERVRESTDDAQITGNVVPVAARVSGTVQKVLVDDNQQVKAGDVLVQLDPSDYQVALDKAQADLANAQAHAQAAQTGVPISSANTQSQLAIARANVNAAEKEVLAAQARLQEAESRHKVAADDLKRFQQLIAKDEISQQQFDTASANEQMLQSGVQAAQAAVATAQSHVAQAQAQLRAAETAPQQIAVTRSQAGAASADVQTKQAAVEQAKLNLQYCTLRAAVDGVVTRKTVEPGQIVQPGTPMMALVPLDDIWVVGNFKENQLNKMRVGQPVNVHVDAYDRDYKGHVNSIGAASSALTSLLPPENATGNFVKVVQRLPVKITFDKGQDPNHLLRPGMSVVPTVMTNQ